MSKAFAARAATITLIIASFLSCQSGKKSLFGGAKTAHAKYSEGLDKAGLLKSALAQQWTDAAENSLAQPISINIPHKEAGYFAADEPEATGFICNLRRGAKINMSLQTVPASGSKVFLELWKIDTSTKKREYLAEADSTLRITHEVENDGTYLIRLQPELLTSIEYTLTIITEPSLAFPVSESGKPALISFWNDRRDAGRNHEGVDIKAAFRTPAISAANGYVRSVTNNRLGGKVVFMRPEGKDYALYYAHLDSQTVSSGQNVSIGDTIGLVGNTGNAINTPPHLHFGIYARGGAVDPLPFIDNRPVELKEITAPRSYLNKFVRAKKKAKIYQTSNNESDTVLSLQQGALVKVVSVSSDMYRVQTPLGERGYIDSKLMTDNLLRSIKTDSTLRLLNEPFVHAASMASIPEGTSLSIYGTTDNFLFVKYKNLEGWIEK